MLRVLKVLKVLKVLEVLKVLKVLEVLEVLKCLPIIAPRATRGAIRGRRPWPRFASDRRSRLSMR